MGWEAHETMCGVRAFVTRAHHAVCPTATLIGSISDQERMTGGMMGMCRQRQLRLLRKDIDV